MPINTHREQERHNNGGKIRTGGNSNATHREQSRHRPNISQHSTFRGYGANNNAFIDKASAVVSRAENAVNKSGGDETGSATAAAAIRTTNVAVQGYVAADKLYQHGMATSIRNVHAAKDFIQSAPAEIRKVKETGLKIAKATRNFVRNPHSSALRVKTRVIDRLKTAKPIKATLKTAEFIQKTYYGFKVVRGAVTGRTTVKLGDRAIATPGGRQIQNYVSQKTKNAVKTAAQHGRKGVRTAAGNAGHTLAKGGRKLGTGALTASKVGLKTSVNIAGSVGGTLANSDDIGLQAAGMGLQTAQVGAYGVRTAAKGVRTGITGTKRTINGAKTSAKYMSKGFRFLRKNGIKRTAKAIPAAFAKSARRSAQAAARKAAAVLARSLIGRFGAPIVIVIAAVLAVSGTVTTITNTVAVLFGETTTVVRELVDGSEENETISEEDFLIERITEWRSGVVDEVINRCNELDAENGGSYHYIHFYNGFADAEVELNADNVDRTIYSVEQYYEMIQPIFHSMLLSEYQLHPTEDEMEDTFVEIASRISEVQEEDLPMEYCAEPCSCGDRHTGFCGVYIHNFGYADNCPDHEYINHGDDNYTCDRCCYYYWKCKGHQGHLTCSITEHEHNITREQAEAVFFEHFDSVSVGEVIGNWKLENKSRDGDTVSITVSCAFGCGQNCGGHTHSAWNSREDSGCYNTCFHDENGNIVYYETGDLPFDCGNAEQHSHCNGYHKCNGHTAIKVQLKCDDWDTLIDEFYDNEIEELEQALADDPSGFTNEQRVRLSMLRTYREVALANIEIIKQRYGSDEEEIPVPNIEMNNIANFAVAQIGKPYMHGGEDLNTGTDALGFVRAVYGNFNIELPRSFRGLGAGYTLYEYDDVQSGDIVLYSNSDENGIYHAGIYIGNGLMVHAVDTEHGIKLSRIYSRGVWKVIRPTA